MASYPGYTGNVNVRGAVRVFPKDIKTTTVAFTLAGLEPLLVGQAHIHVGTSCDDAGGHYYTSNIADPWTKANCPVTANAAGVAVSSFDIAYGYDTLSSLGHTVPHIHNFHESGR